MKEFSDETIFDYFNGSLDPETRRAFEARLQSDPAFAARIALERDIDTALGDTAENTFRANLDHISQKIAMEKGAAGIRNRKWFGLLGLALIISGLVYFYTQQLRPESGTMPPSVPETTQPATPQSNQPIAQNEPALESPVPKNTLLAAAYRPIPRLEQYIHSQVRSGGFKIQITQPLNDAVFTPRNGKVEFFLKGNTLGEKPEDSKFRLLLFNNDPVRFASMKAVEEQALPLNSNHSFEWRTQLALAPGLYYILIEEENSGEWYHVARFQLKQG